MFAIRKYKGDPGQVKATVEGALTRTNGRLRIEQIDVTLMIENEADNLPKLDRVLEQFEEFCIVTQSVKSGIPVEIKIIDSTNKVLK